MKIHQPVLASLLFVLLSAGLAAAAPLEPTPAEPAAPTAAEPQPADLFGVSVLNAGAGKDCGAAPHSPGFGLQTCGHCSPDPCANAELYSICGSDGSGELKRCIDDSGLFCRHSGPICVCRTGPI